MPTAAVVVVGDVGRSPRTANQALSLADEKGYDVCLIGYTESALNERIASHPRIRVIGLPPPPSLPWLPELPALCWRFAWTAAALLATLLLRVGWSLNLVLVQNPPALPALIVAWMAARLRGARFVVDWHNYTWSMLAERWAMREAQLGLEMWEQEGASVPSSEEEARKRRVIGGGRAAYVRLTHYLEGCAGRAADAGLCVSTAMAADLKRRWGVQADVFYDRPPQWKFDNDTPLERIHDLLERLLETDGGARRALGGRGGGAGGGGNAFTRLDPMTGQCELREDRPMMVLSSTSWTPDEDFSILLQAAIIYDGRVEAAEEKERVPMQDYSLPDVVFLITGRGPQKEEYMRRIEQLQLQHCSFYAPWLEAGDYPTAVAAADLGVCLHTSTSGIDLPMKVVDMFGCGVPVLAKRFPAIGELVKEGVNGYLFDDPEQLAAHLLHLARGHPRNEMLHGLRDLLQQGGGLRSWEEEWPEATQRAFRDEREEAFRRVVE